MTINLFDYFENLEARGEAPAPWTARMPRQPQEAYDLKLIPRAPQWQRDPESMSALEQIRGEAWVESVTRDADAVRLRVADGWIETTGAALEAGGSLEAPLADIAQGRRVSVQFWDANATKALHVGHLRNLAIGNALAAALAQAGAQVERRSRISDMGRAMGEAMAGVMQSGRHAKAGPTETARATTSWASATPTTSPPQAWSPWVSQIRQRTRWRARCMCRTMQPTSRSSSCLRGDRDALELWYKTRAWVIAGQRKTLARLGIAFDRVFFESDFLRETSELAESGLRSGTLKRRADGVVVYATGLKELEELPLVRADGLSTQHMRSLTYALTAPELEDVTSMQVTGTEWVAHLASIRRLAEELQPGLNGGFHPSRSIFHGMVSSQKRALTSSAGAQLIDDLTEWIDAQIDADPARREVRRAHPFPEHLAAQVALGYFLPHAATPDIDFEPEQLLRNEQSLGWDVARAQARRAPRHRQWRRQARRGSGLSLRRAAVRALSAPSARRGGAL